jgi:hypothetical protein
MISLLNNKKNSMSSSCTGYKKDDNFAFAHSTKESEKWNAHEKGHRKNKKRWILFSQNISYNSLNLQHRMETNSMRETKRECLEIEKNPIDRNERSVRIAQYTSQQLWRISIHNREHNLLSKRPNFIELSCNSYRRFDIIQTFLRLKRWDPTRAKIISTVNTATRIPAPQ